MNHLGDAPVLTPPRAYSQDESQALALFLIDAYLIDDPIDSEARVMWIEHHTGLTSEAIFPAKRQAWSAAQHWRRENKVDEVRARIADWLITQ